jgi:hypothetical protein
MYARSVALSVRVTLVFTRHFTCLIPSAALIASRVVQGLRRRDDLDGAVVLIRCASLSGTFCAFVTLLFALYVH